MYVIEKSYIYVPNSMTELKWHHTIRVSQYQLVSLQRSPYGWYIEVYQTHTKPVQTQYLADPCEARDCSTNTRLLIN